MVEMIVIDLDGTLLSNNSEITENNVRAITDAQKHGIEIVIATGRGHFDVQNIFKETDLFPWIIGANGATIHKPNGHFFAALPLDKKKAMPILQWLETHDYYYEVFSDQAIYTPENGRQLIEIELDRLKASNPESTIEKLKHSAAQQFKQFGFELISTYRDLEDEKKPIYNILAFSFDEEKLREGSKKFRDVEDLHVVHSGYHNFEIEDKRVSKGNALQCVAKELGIRMENVLAIGDSVNDISMLKIAGMQVAMGNAAEEVIKVCRYQTDTNDQDGVAKIIYQLMDLERKKQQ